MKNEKYLTEFQTLADNIIEKYIEQYRQSNLEPEEFLNSISDNFGKELSQKAADIVSKSTNEGNNDDFNEEYDDDMQLINGISKINSESVRKLKTKISS